MVTYQTTYITSGLDESTVDPLKAVFEKHQSLVGEAPESVPRLMRVWSDGTEVKVDPPTTPETLSDALPEKDYARIAKYLSPFRLVIEVNVPEVRGMVIVDYPKPRWAL